MTTTSIATVLGSNCRRIRTDVAGVTQDELARAAREVGLKWTASKVRDFESGRSAPTFATVVALTAALDSVTDSEPVRLADLVGFDGAVTVTENFEPTGARLSDFCNGGTWESRGLTLGHTWDLMDVTSYDWPSLTEERVAAGLGISTDELCDVALRLWDMTFSAQRDRLAGANANPQRKGRVTRRLKAELEKALADGNS